jgi:hypothetical protein
MLGMPASLAFFSHAAPLSESRFTIISTLTPSLIMPSQSWVNFVTSFEAFWMIAS